MNSPTSATNGAVFLSYASQDAGAARRICETLRAAGLEVWFDQNELVGGDQWDTKIKRQIRECALFVPIISANTQSRSEGYFRREWNLAVQRLLDMAPGRPFIVPVAIDDTSERDALVAEEFLRVQWMRLPGGEMSPGFVARVRALLQALAAGTMEPLPRRTAPSADPVRPTRRRGLIWAGVAVLCAGAVALSFYQANKRPDRTQQVAVLPFKPIGEVTGGEAFCDGLSETITSQLTQLGPVQSRLFVVPMAEVRKEAIATPSQARAIFRANLTLTGTVQQTDALVRVTVSLVDALSLRIIRSGTFEHPPAELYRLQDRVAAETATWLGLDLTEEARRALAVGQTSSGSAYELYVRARGELVRRNQAGNLDASIVHFQQAIVADPRYALAHAELGRGFWIKYLETKDPRWVEEAKRSCRLALEYGSSLASPHITLATLLNGTGRFEEAVAEAEAALRLDPNSAEASRALARSYQQLNRLDEAEATFKRTLARNPENVQLTIDLGAFDWQVGRTEAAEKCFLRAAELTPDNPLVYSLLGGVYVGMGRPEQAAQALENSLRLKPSAMAYSNLGTLRFRQQRYDESARLFESARELSPRDPVVAGNFADALRFVPARMNDASAAYARAIQLAEEALRINAKSAATHASLARFCAFSGQKDRARDAIARARELAPGSVPVMVNAVIVYEHVGDRDRAFEALRLALKGGTSRRELEEEPDLKDLRADSRFASLVAETTPPKP